MVFSFIGNIFRKPVDFFRKNASFRFNGKLVWVTKEAYKYALEEGTLFKKTFSYHRPCFYTVFRSNPEIIVSEFFSDEALEKYQQYFHSAEFLGLLERIDDTNYKEAIYVALGRAVNDDYNWRAPFLIMFAAYLSLKEFNETEPSNYKILKEIDELKVITEDVEVQWLSTLQAIWRMFPERLQQVILHESYLAIRPYAASTNYSSQIPMQLLAEVVQGVPSLNADPQQLRNIKFSVLGNDFFIPFRQGSILLKQAPEIHELTTSVEYWLSKYNKEEDHCRQTLAELESKSLEGKIKLSRDIRTNPFWNGYKKFIREAEKILSAFQESLAKIHNLAKTTELQQYEAKLIDLEQLMAGKLQVLKALDDKIEADLQLLLRM